MLCSTPRSELGFQSPALRSTACVLVARTTSTGRLEHRKCTSPYGWAAISHGRQSWPSGCWDSWARGCGFLVGQDLLAAPVHFNQAVQSGLGTLNSKGEKCTVKMDIRKCLAVLRPCVASISPPPGGQCGMGGAGWERWKFRPTAACWQSP